MNELLNNAFTKVSKPQVPHQENISIDGYGYRDFLNDLYSYMVSDFEYTSEYLVLPTEMTKNDVSTKKMIEFGLQRGLIMVIDFVKTEFSYVEILDFRTRNNLVRYYLTEFYKSDGVSDEDMLTDLVKKDLEKLNVEYIKNINEFNLAIAPLTSAKIEKTLRDVDNEEDLLDKIFNSEIIMPFGVCSSHEETNCGYRGLVLPSFKVSLSSVARFLRVAGLKMAGFGEYEYLSMFRKLQAKRYSSEADVIIEGNAGEIIILGVLHFVK